MPQNTVYQIANAKIMEEDAATIRVSASPPRWFGVAAGMVGCGMLGVVMLMFLPNLLGGIGMGVGLGLAALVAYSVPVETSLTLELYKNQLHYQTRYWLRWPQKRALEASLTQLTEVTQPTLLNEQAVEIWLQDETSFVLRFNQLAEAEALQRRLQGFVPLAADSALDPLPTLAIAPEADAPNTEAPPVVITPAQATQALIQQKLTSWRTWLLVIGGIQLLSGGGFSSWGALLVGVGLASFYFAEAPMLVVYAVTMAWAGLGNLFFGEVYWKGLGLLQFFWAYQLLQQTRRWLGAAPSMARTARWFPWLALGLGGGALLGGMGGFLGLVGVRVFFHVSAPQLVLGGAIIGLEAAGLLGLATGLASWMVGHPRKWWALAGGMAGVTVLLVELGFIGVSLWT